ncbi:hypothetical protein ACQQ2N_00410 [Dokdonella sp. MW10]|uniref:hypothetical protein n=1 Tax=Dokdonella sp. MW10 TaxID=2992926 RepID=UPI003F7D7784
MQVTCDPAMECSMRVDTGSDTYQIKNSSFGDEYLIVPGHLVLFRGDIEGRPIVQFEYDCKDREDNDSSTCLATAVVDKDGASITSTFRRSAKDDDYSIKKAR